MWWKVIFEVILVITVLGIGVNFWACAKSRSHLNRVLRDTNELKQFLEFVGREKIVEASNKSTPMFGSYDANIAALEKSHFAALVQVRNILFVVLMVVLALSYLLGVYFLVANTILFVFLSVAPMSPSAQNNNFAHIQGIITNLYAWNRTDGFGCSDYCTRRNPSLKHLYELIARL